MTFILKDRVRENSVTTGTGDIALAGAPAGYRRFSSVLSIGDTFWYAIVLPGGAWETGLGTYTNTNNMQRTSVIDSSTGALVNFGAGTKDVFIASLASKADARNNSFPSGTLMLFQQTNAPLYWTKQVTHNDKALRVVSGAAGSGGATAFSAILNGTIAGNNTTITQAQMPSHVHQAIQPTQTRNDGTSVASFFAFASSQNTSSTGGDGAHSHTTTMNIQYVDLIIASKD